MCDICGPIRSTKTTKTASIFITFSNEPSHKHIYALICNISFHLYRKTIINVKVKDERFPACSRRLPRDAPVGVRQVHAEAVCARRVCVRLPPQGEREHRRYSSPLGPASSDAHTADLESDRLRQSQASRDIVNGSQNT